MKDKFFLIFDKFYEWIYKVVTFITYTFYATKKCTKLNAISYRKNKEIKKYWKSLGVKNINTKEFKFYQEIDNNFKINIIPDTLWHTHIEPYFNNIIFEKGNKDKNYFELIVGKSNSPITVLRCINGIFLDRDYKHVSNQYAYKCLENEKEYICKPSIDSGGGRGIRFIKYPFTDNLINKLKDDYRDNFIIQEVLEQSKFMNKLNSSSINTIRIMSLIYEDKFHLLSSFVRVGGGGARIDNVSSGGYYIHLTKEGQFKEYAITRDKKTKKIVKHTEIESGFDYYGKFIPKWEEIISLVSSIHFKLADYGIINWDIMLDKNDKPIIIEYNLIDSSPSTHQICNGPILGELTEPICKEIFKKSHLR